MCVVSMVGDHYANKWQPIFGYPPPGFTPNGIPVSPSPPVGTAEELARRITERENVPRFEFDKLKAEVEEMKELLKRAIDYDKRNNEPNCQIEDKMDFLRKVAALVGVDLDDVIGGKK